MLDVILNVAMLAGIVVAIFLARRRNTKRNAAACAAAYQEGARAAAMAAGGHAAVSLQFGDRVGRVADDGSTVVDLDHYDRTDWHVDDHDDGGRVLDDNPVVRPAVPRGDRRAFDRPGVPVGLPPVDRRGDVDRDGRSTVIRRPSGRGPGA